MPRALRTRRKLKLTLLGSTTIADEHCRTRPRLRRGAEREGARALKRSASTWCNATSPPSEIAYANLAVLALARKKILTCP
jgi:hypothetical protein